MTKNTTCELCAKPGSLTTFEIADYAAQLCDQCCEHSNHPQELPHQHWHQLNETIWSENPAVKILAWQILTNLAVERWAQDLLDQLYLDEDLLIIAQAGLANHSNDQASNNTTRDSNGTVLANGDAVTLIKDLDVKGANFTAKRGTMVKNITLTDDPALIEGKVNGTQIVLKTCFLKKAN